MNEKEAQYKLDLLSDVIWYLRGFVDFAKRENISSTFTYEHENALTDARTALAEKQREYIIKPVKAP